MACAHIGCCHTSHRPSVMCWGWHVLPRAEPLLRQLLRAIGQGPSHLHAGSHKVCHSVTGREVVPQAWSKLLIVTACWAALLDKQQLLGACKAQAGAAARTGIACDASRLLAHQASFSGFLSSVVIVHWMRHRHRHVHVGHVNIHQVVEVWSLETHDVGSPLRHRNIGSLVSAMGTHCPWQLGQAIHADSMSALRAHVGKVAGSHVAHDTAMQPLVISIHSRSAMHGINRDWHPTHNTDHTISHLRNTSSHPSELLFQVLL
mmetsp:Transcript_29406/g.67716  ORF Transcript_29406/g.67716 Transcript_29406/m.67716 type:complete len:261 (-) Transcript_29406:297-1079(-)